MPENSNGNTERHVPAANGSVKQVEEAAESNQQKDSGQSAHNNPTATRPLPSGDMTTAVAPPPATTLSASDVRLHYESLTNFFKYLVGIVMTAITIIVGVGLYFTYNSTADLKTDLRQSMSDMKQDAKATIDNTRDQAKTAIDYTRETAGLQISQIREQAAGIALGEAQKRVDDAFKTNNVQAIVESAARRQVGPVIEREVRGEVDRVMVTLQEDISSLGEIADAGSYMRNGGRPGLEKLIILQKSPNIRVQQRAKAIFVAIADEYERVYLKRLKEDGLRSAFDEYISDEVQAMRGRPGVIEALVKVIRTENNLGQVTYAFLALREVTGYPFRMFDVETVEQWCAKNSTECKK